MFLNNLLHFIRKLNYSCGSIPSSSAKFCFSFPLTCLKVVQNLHQRKTADPTVIKQNEQGIKKT